ncbi:hypothetical protein CPB85DRAFT_445843 [Mucidula mucida]|nr:hypothetical protein CPB85DRAFT_445843 [Mucidula mucida]
MFRSLSLIASSKLLRQLVFDVSSRSADRTITNIWNCFSIVARNIPESPGLPIIHLAYEEQFLTNLFKLDRLVAHSHASCETVQKDHAGLITNNVHKFTKYLVYYSTIKFSRKTCLKIMQLNLLDGPFSDIWQSYISRATELEAPSEKYRTKPPAICDAENCPDRETAPDRLMGCAGCGMKFLYCSRACQRSDWLAGHRETCSEVQRSAEKNYGYPAMTSSRDLHFLQMLVRQYIASFRGKDPTMVRFIDFTQPKVEVTLEDPETYRDTQPDLDELIASAETGGGVLVYSIFPTAHETKIEIMHDDPERPLVYVPQSTNRPY